jgi:hypothetical protein
MNLNYQIANAIHSMVINATFVANHLLVEDEAYVGMLADKVNANEPMQSIRDSLIEYVKSNY